MDLSVRTPKPSSGPHGPAQNHCLPLSRSHPQRERGPGDKTHALPWKWGAGESPASAPTPGRTPRWADDIGTAAVTPTGRPQGSGEHSPAPPIAHIPHPLHPPTATSPNPHFHPAAGQPRRVQRDPPPSASTWVSPSPTRRVQTLSPPGPLYLLATRRGAAALTLPLPWPSGAGEGAVPAHVLAIPGRSAMTLWGAETSPPRTGVHSPPPPALVSCLMSKL